MLNQYLVKLHEMATVSDNVTLLTCLAFSTDEAFAMAQKVYPSGGIISAELVGNFDEIIEKLKAFMDSERGKGAEDGLAYEIAASLLNEAKQGGSGCLEKLPPLKQAILDYATEEFMNDSDESND